MTPEEFIVHILTEHGLTIACAETLTGGGIAQALIRVPGSSRVLGLGVVAYSDQAKVEVLGVDPGNCYIKYEDITAWGASGRYVDRRMFR